MNESRIHDPQTHRDRIDARDECLSIAQKTGLWMGTDFVGGGGLRMIIVDGVAVAAPGEIEAAQRRLKGE